MQAGALSVLEPILSNHHYDPPPSQLSLVTADLNALRLNTEPFSSSLVNDDLHPLGLTYVIAGSHFGNKLLLQKWATASDPCVLLAGRFLSSTAMKDYWRYFAEYLRTTLFTLTDQQRIIESAKTCFGVFEEAYHAAEKSANCENV